MAFVIGGTAGAIVGASIIGAGAGIGGALISSHGAQDAAETQAQAAQQAQQLQYQQFQQQQQNQAPFLAAGQAALPQMQQMASSSPNFSMSDFQADPGYQFALQQGQQAIERSAAARGGLQSGGTLKALSAYTTGQASQEYGNAYNRYMNNQNTQFNRLASLSGLGQTATGQVGQAGQNYANNTANEITGAGNAAAASQVAQGQTWGNTLSSLGSQIPSTLMQYQQMQGMNNYLNRLGGAGGGVSPAGYNPTAGMAPIPNTYNSSLGTLGGT